MQEPADARKVLAMVHPSLFMAHEIKAFEEQLLANRNATEMDASRFFVDHPKFLLLGVGADIRPEVVLHHDNGEATQRVDFFRRPHGSRYWDIIELKSPNKSLIVEAHGNHPRFTAQVEVAISQALDYRDVLQGDQYACERLESKGIHICRPQVVVVVGKHSNEVPADTLRILQDRIRQRGPIDLLSYVDIYEFAKEHYSQTGVITVPAIIFPESGTLLTGAQLANRTLRSSMMAFCVKCKAPQEMKNLTAVVMKNGHLAYKGTCPACDTGLYRIPKRMLFALY